MKKLIVRSTPPITDPNELLTILRLSLRDLYGELEPHSCTLQVQKAIIQEVGQDDDANITMTADLLEVKCSIESARYVQAALTWPTLPPYMDGVLYRIDVLLVSVVGDEDTNKLS
ncbi:hypothetical protein ACA910_017010 [Epithemia clementina (nom. ined.)]